MHAALGQLDSPRNRSRGQPLAIEARGLVKRFDGTLAVDGVDIEVPEGAIYGILGPNGAGKTTTLRMLLGIIDPDAGVRRVLGHERPQDVARLIGYLPEERGLYPSMKAYEAIAFMARDAAFCGHRDRQPNQLRQQLPTWSGFNASWLDQKDLPLRLVRYEDMQADVVGTFHDALAFAGLDVTREEAAQAARFADFGELKKQEAERGFREAPVARAGGNFFRRGISGAWQDELTAEQVAQLEQDHGAMMRRLGYDLSVTDIHEERLAS